MGDLSKILKRQDAGDERTAVVERRLDELEEHNASHCPQCVAIATQQAAAADRVLAAERELARRRAHDRARRGAYLARTLIRATVASTCPDTSVVVGDGPDAIGLAKVPGCAWRRPGSSTMTAMSVEVYAFRDVWIAAGGPAKSDGDLDVREITVDEFLHSPVLQRRYADLLDERA